MGVPINQEVGDAVADGRVEAPKEGLVLGNVVGIMLRFPQPDPSKGQGGENRLGAGAAGNNEKGKTTAATTEDTRGCAVVVLGTTIVEEEVLAEGEMRGRRREGDRGQKGRAGDVRGRGGRAVIKVTHLRLFNTGAKGGWGRGGGRKVVVDI